MPVERTEPQNVGKSTEIVPGLWIRGQRGQNQYVEIVASRSRIFEIIDHYYKGASGKLDNDAVWISSADLAGLVGPLPPFEILTHAYIDGSRRQRDDNRSGHSEMSSMRLEKMMDPRRREALYGTAIFLFGQWKFIITFHPVDP